MSTSRIVRAAAVRAVSVALGAGFAIALHGDLRARAQVHTHGDMVGSISHDSAVVWTRASAAARVSVVYALTRSLQSARETAQVSAGAATDFTAKLRVGGLGANTRYYYATRLTDPGDRSSWTLGPVGTFRTAPSPGTSTPMSFVFSGDIRNHAEFDIFPLMQAHAPDFFVCLGDFPYTDGSRSIDDYRNAHKAIRSSPLLWAFFRSTAIFGLWDDHEVVNNWDAATDPVLVQNGTAVFKEMYPIPIGTSEIFRVRRWGDALDVFLLDCRSHRSTNAEPDLPSKHMLGPVQLDWLKRGLLASSATFKVVATTVPLRYSSTTRDAWNGYMRERADLLGFIAAQRIENVVFISADQHFAASHQHRDGVREFQAGPLAQFVGTPRPYPDPEVRWRATERNYALVHVDPAVAPRRMTIDWYGLSGLLRREVVAASSPARLQVESDLPESGFRLLGGPFLYRETGTAASFPLVEPGGYAIGFADVPSAQGMPAGLDLTVPPGGDVRVRVDYRDVASRGHEILAADGFAEPLSGHTVVDDTTREGPSAWFTDNGFLYQSSNINGPGNGIDQPGTLLVTGDPLWRDYTISVRLRPHDNDAVGVVFRYVDRDNYYRFSMDLQRGYRRLVSKRGGAFRVLAETNRETYTQHRWHTIDAVAVGARLTVRLNGATVLAATDNDHPRGAVGFYSWASHLTAFDDVVVRAGDATALTRTVLFRDRFDSGPLTGWTIVDRGTTDAPSRWAISGGTLQQTSNIHDGDPGAARGTVAVADPVVGDHDLVVALRNRDNDAIGVVFRYVDGDNHYRFSMDAERSYRRLAKVVAGRWTTLWQDAASYDVGEWYLVQVRAVGDGITIRVDGELLATVTDPSHPAGKGGLYCWGSDAAEFEDFVVQHPAAVRPILASVRDGRTTTLLGRAPRSAGQPYLLAVALDRQPGIPLSLLDPADPRVLELAADPVFFATLGSMPWSTGFSGVLDARGALRATIDWPDLPGLGGTALYVGGFTVSAGARIGELLQSVALEIP